MAVCAADSRWQLSPQDCGLVASVVVLSDGAWRTGISGVEAYAGDSQRSEEGYFVSDNNDDGEDSSPPVTMIFLTLLILTSIVMKQASEVMAAHICV